MTFSDTLQAQLKDAMAQAQHENLFIYLILHMILGCRKDNRALATMAGLVTPGFCQVKAGSNSAPSSIFKLIRH